jgi:hypothetical protein
MLQPRHVSFVGPLRCAQRLTAVRPPLRAEAPRPAIFWAYLNRQTTPPCASRSGAWAHSILTPIDLGATRNGEKCDSRYFELALGHPLTPLPVTAPTAAATPVHYYDKDFSLSEQNIKVPLSLLSP